MGSEHEAAKITAAQNWYKAKEVHVIKNINSTAFIIHLLQT